MTSKKRKKKKKNIQIRIFMVIILICVVIIVQVKKDNKDRLDTTASSEDIIEYIPITDIITEENIDGAIREIRMALLEADVNYEIVKEFTNDVKNKALGLEVSKSLKPEEVFIKLIKDELVMLVGNDGSII